MTVMPTIFSNSDRLTFRKMYPIATQHTLRDKLIEWSYWCGNSWYFDRLSIVRDTFYTVIWWQYVYADVNQVIMKSWLDKSDSFLILTPLNTFHLISRKLRGNSNRFILRTLSPEFWKIHRMTICSQNLIDAMWDKIVNKRIFLRFFTIFFGFLRQGFRVKNKNLKNKFISQKIEQ